MESRKEHLRSRLSTFLRFNAVGLANSVLDALVFSLLVLLQAPPAFAQAAGYGAGLLNSYWMNGRWTFRKRRLRWRGREFRMFVLFGLIALIGSTLCMAALNSLSVPLALAKLLTIVSTVLFNYYTSRRYVFRPETE